MHAGHGSDRLEIHELGLHALTGVRADVDLAILVVLCLMVGQVVEADDQLLLQRCHQVEHLHQDIVPIEALIHDDVEAVGAVHHLGHTGQRLDAPQQLVPDRSQVAERCLVAEGVVGMNAPAELVPELERRVVGIGEQPAGVERKLPNLLRGQLNRHPDQLLHLTTIQRERSSDACEQEESHDEVPEVGGLAVVQGHADEASQEESGNASGVDGEQQLVFVVGPVAAEGRQGDEADDHADEAVGVPEARGLGAAIVPDLQVDHHRSDDVGE